MATAFDHMAPFQRLNYWLRQRIGELNEEIRLLSSEKKMWMELELRNLQSSNPGVVSYRTLEIDSQLNTLYPELGQWEKMLETLPICPML